jgi:hypothetical protein
MPGFFARRSALRENNDETQSNSLADVEGQAVSPFDFAEGSLVIPAESAPMLARAHF